MDETHEAEYWPAFSSYSVTAEEIDIHQVDQAVVDGTVWLRWTVEKLHAGERIFDNEYPTYQVMFRLPDGTADSVSAFDVEGTWHFFFDNDTTALVLNGTVDMDAGTVTAHVPASVYPTSYTFTRAAAILPQPVVCCSNLWYRDWAPPPDGAEDLRSLGNGAAGKVFDVLYEHPDTTRDRIIDLIPK